MSQLPDKEVVGKPIRAKQGNTCINTPIYGRKDPRGPDNNVRTWLDPEGKLHIRLEKTNRCYQFERVEETDAYVEVIAV